LFAKASAGVIFMMWLRWTLPRLRIDQVMTTCLKYCLPLASAMLAFALVWSFRFPGTAFFGILNAAPPRVASVADDTVQNGKSETASPPVQRTTNHDQLAPVPITSELTTNQ
jgi:NADH-quinone oxidoreductase subunit H